MIQSSRMKSVLELETQTDIKKDAAETQEGNRDRKLTLSAHFWWIPTLTHHFPCRHHQSNNISLQKTSIIYKWKWMRMEYWLNKLRSCIFLCHFFFFGKQTNLFSEVLTHTQYSPGDVSGDWACDSGSRHIADGSEGQDRKWLQTGKEEVGSKEAGRFPAANLGPEMSSLPVWVCDGHPFSFFFACTRGEGN